MAGNRESPAPGVNATADDSGVNLGALPTVPGTTPPDFGIAPEPAPTPSTNPLFTAAETGIPNAMPLTRPSEFDAVISPFAAQAFATGIAQSHADIGPMAIAEAPDGSFLISGGPNRGQIFRFEQEGGKAGAPWASLSEPVFNLAFDGQGRLWATTGGGALLQLNSETGAVINRFGDGVTIALAVEPGTDRLFVSTNAGVQIFDPATGLFTQYSRDGDLRVGSLAFAQDGTLWATTWPDRRQVVRFTERARAEVMLEFESDIDSLAFGRPGTALDGLLFVSHNAGPVSAVGAAAQESELTMVDVATLRRVAVAKGGTRGDVVLTTSDGRVLLSQSHQVDVVNPVYAPSVVATNPPRAAVVPLPLPFISVTFDQDMFVGDAGLAQSVLNTANYTVTGGVTGARPVQSVTYDEEGRTVLLTFQALLPDAYTLTVEDTVASVFGRTLAADYTTSFSAVSDLERLRGHPVRPDPPRPRPRHRVLRCEPHQHRRHRYRPAGAAHPGSARRLSGDSSRRERTDRRRALAHRPVRRPSGRRTARAGRTDHRAHGLGGDPGPSSRGLCCRASPPAPSPTARRPSIPCHPTRRRWGKASFMTQTRSTRTASR